MAKKLPLLRRLELALTQTSSEFENGQTLGLFSQIARNLITKKSSELFYANLNHQTLIIKPKIEISREDIIEGEELYQILKNSINIPEPSMGNGYRKKIKAAIRLEVDRINEFYEGKK